VDASLLWELTRKWSAVGRWNYSFDDDTTLGAFAGFEYDSCCWTLRFVARKFINKNDGDTTGSVFMQVEFKGLGAVGKPVDELLERAILGYRRNPIE
jgi:LPS-assembly protein